MKRYMQTMNKLHIRLFALLLLLLTAAPHQSWATDVTYHILTLPIDNGIYHMKAEISGKRLEAVKVVVTGQTHLELPAHFKSPLATGFTYYKASDVTKSGSAEKLFDATNNSHKAFTYEVKVGATPVAEKITELSGTKAEYYVVYTYNASNTIAQLNGSVKYNLSVKNKGFFSLNRGRSNRPAAMPKAKVDAEMLASEDFVYINNPGSGIVTYWENNNDQKNKKEDIQSQFHFTFKFEGVDPYNIIIRTAYDKNTTYIEKNDNSSEYVYKYYKESSFFTNGTAKGYFASDEHRHYNYTYDSSLAENPTNLTEGSGTGWDTRTGYYHGQKGQMWNSFALLYNSDKSGYVFMGTRTVDGNGNVPGPTNDGKYYYLKTDNNDFFINQQTTASVSSNYTIEGIYPIKPVTFKVKTPFYAIEATDAHIVSATTNISQYTIDNDDIDDKFIPNELRRKYCTFTPTYRNSDGDVITKYSQMKSDGVIFLEYNVSESLPFKAITPAASYDANTWNSATWYELTDDGSTQENGKKINYDGSNYFLNNGASGTYEKTSEYAFIGDPYELRVVLRSATSGASATYVGASTVSTGTDFTASTLASAGYNWEIPADDTAGSFLLRNYKDANKGYWYWATDRMSAAINYNGAAQTVDIPNSNAQTVTLNISSFTGGDGHYFKMTAAGTNPDQIDSNAPALTDGMGAINGTSGTATITVKNGGGVTKSFTLTIQEYNRDNAVVGTETVITVNQAASAYAGGNVEYNTSASTRVKILELPKFDYTYHVIDMSGTIAIKATVKQTIFTPLSGYDSIPEIIRSPFLADETVTYYKKYSGGGRGSLADGDIIYEVPNSTANIFISYTLTKLSTKNIKLDASQQFKVKLDEEYIYVNSDKILSTPTAEATDAYSWELLGQDPYAMMIRNKGNSKYVRGTWTNDVALDFVEEGNASRFIAMMGKYIGVYEVMAATGNTNYFHIGRPSTSGAETRVYSTTTYDHGADELRFELAGVDAIVYHLIDKANNKLLSVSSFNPRLALPAEYVSPLVSTYYYYKTLDGARNKTEGDKITEITQDDDKNIYVTYDVNDLIGFNNTGRIDDHPYLLKFLDPLEAGYYLEDGSDKLTSDKIQAIYPYCNGDGNLNIYGQKMRDEQMEGGSSTRSRWVWFFESSNNDPYHVKIHSRNTVAYNGVNHPTYLQTSAVHFNQDTDPNAKHIVTGGFLQGLAAGNATEYMILGTAGQYRLKTTDEIEGARRNVTSFEQYWKTYNMIKRHLLNINEDTFSEDASTWVVPENQRDALKSALDTKGIGGENWHSYDVYATAIRWNGYNDKSTGKGSRIVEKLEHWFQTFDMGNGSFNVETAIIPPVLVLLDRHGWEIMRKPLPDISTYPLGDDELKALRAYDSPLVKEYKFYSQATKASGCHKYSLRYQDGKERDQIKAGGKHWTSQSLADLPPIEATGVKSNGVMNDQFVTYTVKEEYEMNYDYTLDPNTFVETGESQPYLVVQNGRFYKTPNQSNNTESPSYISKPIHEHTRSGAGNVYDLIVDPVNHGGSNANILNGSGNFLGNNFWRVKPNLDIDEEMGISWGVLNDTAKAEPLSKEGTKKKYEKKTGFDPYNIQLQLINKDDGTTDGRYLTTHMTSTRRDNGSMVGDYSGSDGTEMITLEEKRNAGADDNKLVHSEGYDHSDMKITNQTFMAVSDANGNMQLMPRFDHSMRVNLEGNNPWYTQLKASVDHAKASADDGASMGPQTTFFVRPQRFHYHIIDNEGREALRYKRGGDYYPAITDHFKSPIAKDFKFYYGLTLTDGVYTEIKNKTDISEKEITGSFAATGEYKTDNPANDQNAFVDVDEHVYVRYSYDEDADLDRDEILQGQWFTVQLNSLDVKCGDTEAIDPANGTGVSLLQGESKPNRITATDNTWQWKFLAAPTEETLPSGDPNPYYMAPDPYAVQLFNRKANYSPTLVEPSPMSIGIKVPNQESGADRFVLLSHPNGGYALAVAKTYDSYEYPFLNGGSMTTSEGATTVNEAKFTYKDGTITDAAQLIVNNDVTHNYTYYVINNAGKMAISDKQTNEEAESHKYAPYLPEAIQTPLLNVEDYLYYGSIGVNNQNTPGDTSDDTYEPVDATKLYTLYGLYDDKVYVRYEAYDMDKTPFKVPNVRNATSETTVAKGESSQDASLNIEGGLPYNIIWHNDDMMSTNDADTEITKAENHSLSGEHQYVWYFEGGDPYALKIKHKLTGNYVNGTTILSNEAGAKQFMLLKKIGYDYGILQVMGTTGADAGKKLTGFGGALTSDASTNPNHYVIFGLSVHDLIYRLIIARTCTKAEETSAAADQYVDIPFRETESGVETTKRIFGSTQRDLTSGSPAGANYQLGSTLTWGGNSHTYSFDAGTVSIGDKLEVPNAFNRPNCTFEFYIEGIYGADKTTPNETLNNKYKGLKRTNLMSDAELIDKTVVVNIVYKFNEELATNNGMDFVRSTNDKCWYTFETQGDVPYLAHYTNAWGMQSMAGRETRYTNDYLWTPVGDVYGFKLYNRYMIKNSDGSDKVMTFTAVDEGKKLAVVKPGASATAPESGTYTTGNEIFELLTGDNPNSGYFRVHPVVNTKDQTQYYVKRGTDNYAVLSTTPSDWAFGLDMSLMAPYYERAGYVGGLNTGGKAAYEAAATIMDIQHVVYDDANIIPFTKGYYRLHNQPGVSRINPVRYASGYLHDIEKTAVSGGIPMHFYSREGVNTTFAGEGGLGDGFTVTNATQGEIPVPATEYDPSTIFYLNGAVTSNKTISEATMSTQGLNVSGNKMTTGTGTTFTLIDIGGAVFLITDILDPGTRNYFNFAQTSNIYDVKFMHESPTDDAKWCLQPVQKTTSKGNGEMPLKISTNNGGDGHYYATFYAPYDVMLPDNAAAFTCDKWNENGVHPTKVSGSEGKFIPAGTPAIIRTTDESGNLTLTLPNSEPTSSSITNIFIGSYLEQLLDVDAAHDVYTLGLPFISNVEKDPDDYNTTGDIVAPVPEQANTGVGFYINATRNKENGALAASWDRNNRYVLHNKIYYRATGGGAGTRGVQFVPVVFEAEAEATDVQGVKDYSEGVLCPGNVYNLQGRCVATEEMVKDGTWKNNLTPGVYIMSGKKIIVK